MSYSWLLLLPLFSTLLFGQFAPRGISAAPPLTGPMVADLESRLQAAPDDMAARESILAFYSAAPQTPEIQSNRLRHIRTLVEQYPESRLAGSRYARLPLPELTSLWANQAAKSPDNVDVIRNAFQYLAAADKASAEDILIRAMDSKPNEPRFPAWLGFLHGLGLLRVDSVRGETIANLDAPIRDAYAQHAQSALDSSSNATVLAAAAALLPNVARYVRNMELVPAAAESAGKLMARARQLAPDSQELAGPMPMIQYLQELMEEPSQPSFRPAPGISRIRVGGNVQAAKLVKQTQPEYPSLAREARIQGTVRFNITIASDGTVRDAALVSGHPLLVPAATEAIKTWKYQPTLLNGAPVEVLSVADVPFTLQP